MDETLKIIEKILDYNKEAQKLFHHSSKVDKRKSKPKIEETIAERVKLKNQKNNLSETPIQKKFNNFLKQIKEEQKNIDINLFKNVFNYESSDKMLKYLHNLKITDDNNKAGSLIDESFINFVEEVRYKLKGDKKDKGSIILNIFNDILNFTSKERKSGKGLKISTPNQMLCRLPVTLAQLKAGNNSEKLKNEIRQLLYSLYR